MKKYQNYFCFVSALISLSLMIPRESFAQQTDSIDNGYYVSYPNQWIARLYLSQKYAPFTISTANSDKELNYKANSKLYLGAGVTYGSITVNLSFGFSFLNKEKGKGKTKGLDFQFHLYPHKWAVDLLGSFRNGYYLDPKSNTGLSLSDYYVRPDVKRSIVGFSAYRVPNSGKFSFRAAFLQNDRQLKSAGSILYGGEAYLGSLKGDSALVPKKVSSIYSQTGITKVNFITIGPGVGYAYTLVLAKYFFMSGSIIGHLDVNFSTESIVPSSFLGDFITKSYLIEFLNRLPS